MSQLAISRPYIGGDPVLFASELSIPFTNIEDFFNTTGIGADNLQPNSIDTSHIAVAAVTTPKIAEESVTTAKLAAGAVLISKVSDSTITSDKIASAAITKPKREGNDQYGLSAGTGIYNANTSPTTTVLTTPTISCTGANTILVTIRSLDDDPGGAQFIRTINTYTGFTFRIYRSDGGLLAEYDAAMLDSIPAGGLMYVLPASLAVIDSPPAGSFYYYATISDSSVTGSSPITIRHMRLECVELW